MLKSDVYGQALLVSDHSDPLSELTTQLLTSASTEVLDTCYMLVTSHLKGLPSNWKQLDSSSKMVILKQAVSLVKLQDPLLSSLILGIISSCAKEQHSDPLYSSTLTQLLTALYHQDNGVL